MHLGLCQVISDFGVSRVHPNKSDMMIGSPGTPTYTAPEVFLGKAYNESIDVYGYAMCLFEIHTSDLPFENAESVVELMRAVAHGGQRPEWPVPAITDQDQFLRGVITKCWQQDPEKRPTFSEIKIMLQAYCDQNGEGAGRMARGDSE